MLITARTLKDIQQVRILLRKAGLETRLMEFLPANKRTDENFKNLFQDKGLSEIVNIQKSLVSFFNIDKNYQSSCLLGFEQNYKAL